VRLLDSQRTDDEDSLFALSHQRLLTTLTFGGGVAVVVPVVATAAVLAAAAALRLDRTWERQCSAVSVSKQSSHHGR
jgi:hypothetical protein